MTPMILRRVTAGAVLLLAAGCGLLDVSDPTAVEDKDVATATGADLLRRDAIGRLYRAISEAVVITGILSDELNGREDELDKRNPDNSSAATGTYTLWNEARRSASLAIPRIRLSGVEASKSAYVGEMFAVKGFASLNLAESFCAGFPLHDVIDFTPVYGEPLTTMAAFERALADFDSAAVLAADSARILNFARVGRARTLLGLGRFADAAEAVRDVATEFHMNAEFNSSQENLLGRLWSINQLIVVGENEGNNGLDYTVGDPRLPVTGFFTFGSTTFYKADKYASETSAITFASGVEARLIEAEAQLQEGNATWLEILNRLRATRVTPAMEPLTDPGNTAARVDLIMRERAFWLFGTGHRLGDLRRLISQYGRTPEDVYPSGTYFFFGIREFPDGEYSTATSLRFPVELESPYNPAITGCTVE